MHLLPGDATVCRLVECGDRPRRVGRGREAELPLFTVSAFSVPLIYYRRASLVAAVVASARAIFGQLPVMLGWACLLALVIIVSAWVLPLLLYTLPVMAYASRSLYRQAFPPV